MVRRAATSRGLVVLLASASCTFLAAQTVQIQLAPSTAPAFGQPGLTSLSVTASNFPSGAVNPSSITITLQPGTAGTAPIATTQASAATVIVGSTERITFQIPPSLLVNAPAAYLISVAGNTVAGTAFASSNTASTTINPPAQLLSLVPNSGAAGQSLPVQITGNYTNFLQGTTQASFGPGVAVGGASSGGFGPIAVISSTTATAVLAIDPAAAAGNRDVQVATGAQTATLTGGFSVSTGSPGIPPVVTLSSSASPGQATPGSIVILDGTGFPAAAISPANITISLQPAIQGTGLNLTTTATAITPASGTTRQVSFILPSNITLSTPINYLVSLAGTASGGVTFASGNTASLTLQPAPLIISVTPTGGAQGQAVHVIVNGVNSGFLAGTTQAVFGNGISVGGAPSGSVGPVVVTSATSFNVDVQIAPNAAIGPRTLTVQTGASQLSLSNGFTVTTGSYSLTLNSSASPSTEAIGNNVQVSAAGFQTSAVAPVAVTVKLEPLNPSSGPTVTTTATGVTPAQGATRQIAFTIPAALNLTAPASYAVSISGTDTAGVAFSSSNRASLQINPPPSILSVTPITLPAGQSATVTLSGRYTNFTSGLTSATFGNGISVGGAPAGAAGPVTVLSPTSATAQISASAAAPPGTRVVTVQTGTEVAIITGGFTVTPAPVSITLDPVTTPAQGSPGNSFIVNAAGFPAGSIPASQITLQLLPVTPGTGPTVNFVASAATGSGQLQISFTVPSTLALPASTPYLLSMSGTTGSGTPFQSSNKAAIRLGPAPLISLNPPNAAAGQSLTVTIAGQFTNFVQGTTTATFGAGISVGGGASGTAGPVTVTSTTSATAQITIALGATRGPRQVTVSTGAEQVTLPGGFMVLVGTVPTLLSASPNNGSQGQTLTGVVITGSLTHFTQGTPVVTFSNTGVTASAVQVTDDTHLTATLTIAANAVAATSNVTVVTGVETASGTGLFTVGNPAPVIMSVVPSTGQQGQQTLPVTINGQFTNFVQGTTAAVFGPGITVASLTINSSTSAAAVLNIDPAAAPGPRTVTITTGTETASLANAFSVTPAPPAITITSPANLSYLNITPTTVNGTVSDPTATVVINGLTATVANGAFSLPVPLAEGPNIITATATSATGIAGSSSVQLTLDTTPPHVTITNPPDQFVTTSATITVGGSINDIVVGTVNAQQAQVTVNGTVAQVSNRMFLANNIPLQMGSNVIQAVGRDQAGNAATTQISVTRQAPAAQPQIIMISGDGQTGIIGSVLPSALVVTLKDATGNPVPNQPVIFKVDQNNGMVASGDTPAATVVVTTNSQGQAQAQWTLGGRAGAGGNTVEAYAVGFSGTALFTATGTQGPAGMIVIDTGNNQTGAINQPLPKPLIAVVVDAGNNRLAGVPVTFTVKQGGGNIAGQQSTTVMSDSDGRVSAALTLGFQEGNLNNLIEANFPSNHGSSASFMASGRAPGSAAKTTINGTVLDNSNQPIPGVTIRVVLTNLLNSNSGSVPVAVTALTDSEGQFSISPSPVGFVKLLVDGTTAQRAGTFPTLDYDMVTIAGQTNTLGLPIFLLPLTKVNQLCVTATTGGGTLTMPEAPGFSLTFGPGQVTFPGGSKTGCVSVTIVHPDKVPMTPGFGQQPRFIVTIQPSGALFNPPAPITLPNVDGLTPRAVTEMYSFDHDIASFVAIGTGTVSDDGLILRSNLGVGVIKAGWHCGGNPNSSGAAATCGPCAVCIGNNCQPDPSRLNKACQNPCVVGGSGNCSASGYCTGTNVPNTTPCNGSGGSCQNGQCVGGGAGGGPCPYNCSSGNFCINDACANNQCTQLPNPACQTVCSGQQPGVTCTVSTGISGTCHNGQCDICGGLSNGTACVSGPSTFGVCQNGQCTGSCSQPTSLSNCPNRQARPLPYIPTSDGCSVPSALLAVLGPVQSLHYSGDPNNPAGGAHTQFGNAARTGPCDKHDYCWGTCSKYSTDDTTNRSLCNLDFDNDMHHVCTLAGIAGDPASIVDLCDRWADVISDAVDNNLAGIPNRKYIDAQKDACVCCQ